MTPRISFFKAIAILLIGLFLFCLSDSAEAGRCSQPPRYVGTGLNMSPVNYNPATDSYIVIEGTISGLDPSYVEAYPDFSNVSLGATVGPGGITICPHERVVVPQTKQRGYYCYYFIIKNTKSSQKCWDYFKSLNTLNLAPSNIIVFFPSGREQWTPQPSSRTVTLSPVIPVQPIRMQKIK